MLIYLTSEITQVTGKGAEGHAYTYVCVLHLFQKEKEIRRTKKKKMRGTLVLVSSLML